VQDLKDEGIFIAEAKDFEIMHSTFYCPLKEVFGQVDVDSLPALLP